MQTNFQIGNIIKSYSCRPSLKLGDCYMIGEVTSVSDVFIEFKVLQVVFNNKTVRLEYAQTTSFTAVPGKLPVNEWLGRVTVLAKSHFCATA